MGGFFGRGVVDGREGEAGEVVGEVVLGERGRAVEGAMMYIESMNCVYRSHF